jgi:putative transposase
MVSNEQVKEWLCSLICDDEGESYGYRKLTHALRRNHDLVINHKKVYRLCAELDILRPQRRIKEKQPKRIAINRTITRSNQLWETDVKYGYIAGENRFFFVMPVLDVCDRSVVEFHIGLSCGAIDAARAIQGALFKRQLFDQIQKPVIRTDNGPQFISSKFAESCAEFGLTHERIPCRTPNKNAHVEAFNGILEDECFARHEFSSYGEAYQVVSEFIRNYNNRRIHSSLKYHTPAEAFTLLQQNRLNIKEIRA